MILEPRTMRRLIVGICASFVAVVAAAVFMAVSLSARSDGQSARERNVTIEGGGCQPESSVLATIGDERVGSTRADRAGNFRFTALLPEGDRSSLVSMSCGTIAFSLSGPAVETTKSGRSIAVMAFVSGALVLIAVLIVLLRRRLAIDLRDPAARAPDVPVAETAEREPSDVSAGEATSQGWEIHATT